MLLRFIFSVRRGCGFFHTSPEFFFPQSAGGRESFLTARSGIKNIEAEMR